MNSQSQTNEQDAQFRSTLLIFSIDLAIFLLYITIFFGIRHKRRDQLKLPNWRGGDHILNVSRFTQKDLR
jgi:hypothetical protein